jgi:hypothetical protein
MQIQIKNQKWRLKEEKRYYRITLGKLPNS